MPDPRVLWSEPIPEKGWRPPKRGRRKLIIQGLVGTGQAVDLDLGTELLIPSQAPAWQPPVQPLVTQPWWTPVEPAPEPDLSSGLEAQNDALAQQAYQQEQEQTRRQAVYQQEAMPRQPARVVEVEDDREPGQIIEDDDDQPARILQGSQAQAGGPMGGNALPKGAVQLTGREGFLQSALPYALETERRYGIPAQFTLALAINEHAGDAQFIIGENNYFGIQAGPDEPGVPYRDWRPGPNGERIYYDAKARSFTSPQEGFDFFGALLANNPRYAAAVQGFKETGDLGAFVRGIHAGGYAEDPAWADKVLRLAGEMPKAPPPRNAVVAGDGIEWQTSFDFGQPYDQRWGPNSPTHHRGVDLVVAGAARGGQGRGYGAFLPGTVVAAGPMEYPSGLGVIVQGDDGLFHRYFHNDRVLVGPGDRVDIGTPIGVVGETGTEGSPHLHFEVSKNVNGDPIDQLIDPRPYIPRGQPFGRGQAVGTGQGVPGRDDWRQQQPGEPVIIPVYDPDGNPVEPINLQYEPPAPPNVIDTRTAAEQVYDTQGNQVEPVIADKQDLDSLSYPTGQPMNPAIESGLRQAGDVIGGGLGAIGGALGSAAQAVVESPPAKLAGDAFSALGTAAHNAVESAPARAVRGPFEQVMDTIEPYNPAMSGAERGTMRELGEQLAPAMRRQQELVARLDAGDESVLPELEQIQAILNQETVYKWGQDAMERHAARTRAGRDTPESAITQVATGLAATALAPSLGSGVVRNVAAAALDPGGQAISGALEGAGRIGQLAARVAPTTPSPGPVLNVVGSPEELAPAMRREAIQGSAAGGIAASQEEDAGPEDIAWGMTLGALRGVGSAALGSRLGTRLATEIAQVGPKHQQAQRIEEILRTAADPGTRKTEEMYSRGIPDDDSGVGAWLKGLPHSTNEAWFDDRASSYALQAEGARQIKAGLNRTLRENELFTEHSRFAATPRNQVRNQRFRRIAIEYADVRPIVRQLQTHMDNLDVAASEAQKAGEAVMAREMSETFAQSSLRIERGSERLAQHRLAVAQAAGDQRAVQRETRRIGEINSRIQGLEQQVARQEAAFEFRRYQQAQSAAANQWRTRKFPGDLTAAESEAALDSLHQTVPPQIMARAEEAVALFREFIDDFRKDMLEHGVWSQELYDDLTERFPNYIPTEILAHLEKDSSLAQGRSLSLRDRGLRHLTPEGTVKDRQDTYASILKYGHAADNMMLRNDTYNALVNMRNAAIQGDALRALSGVGRGPNEGPPMGELLRTVPSDYTLAKGEAFITGYENGVKTRYVTSGALAKSLQLAPSTMVPQMARDFTTAFRAMITRMPMFVAGQIPLDFYAALTRNLAWEGGNPTRLPYIWWELMKGYAQVLNGLPQGEFRGDVAKFLLEGGGMSGLYQQSARAWSHAVDDITRRHMFEIRNAHDVQALARWLFTGGFMDSIGHRQDLAMRVASMNMALKRGETMTQAVMRGRDVTLDFQRAGYLARTLNQLIPFLNVGFQGAAIVPRMMRANPVAALASIGVAVSLPVIFSELWNRQNPEMAEAYNNVPDYIKDRGIIFMMPGIKGQDAQGNPRPNYALFPIREYAPFMIMTRAIANRVLGGTTSERDIWGYAGAMGAGSSPISANNPEDAVSFLIPPGFSTVMQIINNRDWFRGQNVRTKFADEQASNISKYLAGALQERGVNIAPSQIEFVSKDLFGGLAAMAHGASNLTPGTPNRGDVNSRPILGGLTKRFLGDAIGGELRRTQGTGGVKDPAVLALFRKAGYELNDPPFDLPYSGMEGARIPLTRAEQLEFQNDEGRIIMAQMSLIDKSSVSEDTLERVVGTARKLATDALLAGISPSEAKRRIKIETNKDDKASEPARRNAATLMADINDPSKYPQFIMPDGEKLGMPSEWVEMKAEIAKYAGVPEELKPSYIKPLQDAKKRADANRLMALWADPRYPDYERYVNGQIGAGMDNAQWQAYQSGAAPKYDLPGTGPRDWREMDQTLKLYRTLPAGDPLKRSLEREAKGIMKVIRPDWRRTLEFDELTGQKITGELDALDRLVIP